MKCHSSMKGAEVKVIYRAGTTLKRLTYDIYQGQSQHSTRKKSPGLARLDWLLIIHCLMLVLVRVKFELAIVFLPLNRYQF